MAYRIDKSGGCGGFLNPPGHPEQTMCVRGTGRDDGIMSLSYAIGEGSTCLPVAIIQEAAEILDAWEENRPPIDQDWVHQVLGYFRNMYADPACEGEDKWRVENLRSLRQDLIPTTKQDIDNHAGVHFIWKFYPDYVPTSEDFEKAYWGQKPDSEEN